MPEFREDLLITAINKKRVIGIILVTVLLIAAFALSILLSSLIFGGQRPSPSDELSKARQDEGIQLIKSPFPFNFSDFQNMNLTQDQLSNLLDMLQNMFDGNITNLDLGNYSQGLLALLASQKEVFRVYDYNDFNSMSNKLWKYECFDEYTGEGWHSSATSNLSSFYSYYDYNTYHSGKDLIRLKIPLNPTAGINSIVIPNLFPTPFIMEGSLKAPNLDNNSVELYQTDFNSTTAELNFYDSAPVNMSYELFGLDLPSNYEINATALPASDTPQSIKNQFLQLPATVQTYLASNPNVYDDYIKLNNIISPSDNAFMVANKIRNYLQYQFSLPSDPSSYTTAPPGRDVVDYFCETREGLWSDFATAFCVFTRIFGVASRFVDGFNSIGIEQIWDNQEKQNTFAIKYRNIYNWAEVYVPSSGGGRWVQMDVLYDSFGVGGNPWSPENYTLLVDTNFTAGFRNNQDALITASLSQYGAPLQGETISFIDLATDELLGSASTDIYGKASILIPIDSAQVVGPHYITATYNPQTINYTRYDIYGNVQAQLTSINPPSVNLSLSTSTNIQGYLADPLNGMRVRNAQVEFVLLYKGTDTRAAPFFPNFGVTGMNSDFDMGVNADPSLIPGEYEVRVDFNGTFIDPFNLIPFNLAFVNSYSSNRLDFNVTKGSKNLLFYINNVPSSIPNSPLVSRYSTIRLKAYVYHDTLGPLANEYVEFYDYTDGNSFINGNYTNSEGFTTIDYFIGNQAVSGPNLLYAKVDFQKNYSYYVLNDAPTIHLISGPIPRTINRTGGGLTSFNVVGEITDTYDRSQKLGFSNIKLSLLRGGVNYSSYLIPYDNYPFQTGSNGYFNLNFGVTPNTPTGNYTLRLDFNGTINLIQIGNPYPYLFNLPILSNSTYLDYELKITTPPVLKFDFWIDGHDSCDYYNPIINRNEQINLSVYLELTNPLDNEVIEFYDLTQDLYIGWTQTINGRASFIYYTDGSTCAGPHLIYAKWGSNYNYSYFTLNDNIILDVQSGPNPNQVFRGGETFTIQGKMTDGSNGTPIKYAEIYVALLDGTMTDVSYYLSANTFQLDDSGTFDLSLSVDSGTPAANYTLNVGFYGNFIYSLPNNQFNQFNFNFDVVTYSNFTSNDNANYKLKVMDPNNIAIHFLIDGNPALSFYDDGNLPERYIKGDNINFSIYVTQSGSPVSDGTLVLTDVYINSIIGSHLFLPTDNGRWDFIINSISWHAGLHRIRVQWASAPTVNITYIIINDTISISAATSLQAAQRNVDSFNIFGTVQDGSVNLRGLKIEIRLFDSSLNDVSGYLNLAGSQIFTVIDGSYQFDINSIALNCPQGIYYFRIDFNGSVSELGISLSDYMIHSSSLLVPLNITAGTYIVGNYDKTFEGGFYEGDEIHAYGYLYWDNGSLITGSRSITIAIEDGLGGVIKTEIGTTDGTGWFNITIPIDSPDWPDQAQVWANFVSEDNFMTPDHYYIESTNIELFSS
jgi:hypothetical protein